MSDCFPFQSFQLLSISEKFDVSPGNSTFFNAFSSTYDFTIAKGNKLRGKVGLSIRNIYNRKNVISKEYRGNNSLNDPVELIEKFSIGITPNFMFRLYW
jgi:hypothetical protein